MLKHNNNNYYYFFNDTINGSTGIKYNSGSLMATAYYTFKDLKGWYIWQLYNEYLMAIIYTAMNEWMFNDTPAQKAHQLLAVEQR